MNKATYKKRLDKLNNIQPLSREQPPNIQEQIELFNALASEGVISAETIKNIHAKRNAEKFDPYECLTDKELCKLLYLLEPERREQEKKQALDPLWKHCRDLEVEDIEFLDKLIGKYK